MSKGKHRKKQKISISFLVILLLSVSFFSTGIIIGGQLTKTPQSQTYKTEPAQLTSNLTPDEQRLASKIDQLLQKSDYIGSIYVRKNNRVLLELSNRFNSKSNDCFTDTKTNPNWQVNF